MITEKIRELIKETIKELQKEGVFIEFKLPEIIVEHPEEKTHGDYSTNVAMVIAKQIKKNPLEIAKQINWKLKIKNWKFLDKVEVIEPGFINFFFSKEYLISELKRILIERDKYGLSKIGKGKTVIIDYSAPNIAKSFGVGHLRSTIIGQALYNIYKFLDWKCIGDNHLGDWGTQFGKLIVAIKLWNEKKLKDLTIQELEILYVKLHQEAEKNPELLEQARQEFKKLEQGDKEIKKIWQFCVSISLKEFDKIYKLLGVKIDYALGESFYQDKMKAVIEGAKKRDITEKSQDALVIPLQDIKIPLMLLKSDGATTYATRDLATIKYRIEKWKPDLIIYEVGADQKLYLQQLFKSAEMLGYGNKEKFVHVAHGLVRWPHGKFSTRRGDTIHLEKVLEEAIVRAKEMIEKSTFKNFSQKEKEKVAKIVGIGAIKYNDLSRHHSQDIIFDWERILSLDGNSGPYLQYTAVRCQSVLDKIKKEKFEINPPLFLKKWRVNQEEELILRNLYKFPEIVQRAADSFSPNIICNFAFDLSQKYNLFYEKHPILTAETNEIREFRLTLTAGVKQVLKNCLTLLGISIPEKM